MKETSTITLHSGGHVLYHLAGDVGVITLNRAQALHALSLAMIRDLTAILRAWRDDPAVKAVFVRSALQEGKSVAFCAGGDIRFFHQAALAGNPQLDDFFTEEYALNHLIHTYPKPYIAWMDGIVMGGGMGISQGARLRIVTERTKMAMPETNIGLFPDVGGGWFLSRCPGHVGEYLALTGQVIGAGDAIAWGLADGYAPSDALGSFEAAIAAGHASDADVLRDLRGRLQSAPAPVLAAQRAAIDRHFAAPDVAAIMASLQQDDSAWAQETLAALRKRSPLMMCVTLEQVRRARSMSLADDLRMERDLVRNCFALRPGAASETVEGIRALAVDKDHQPRWNPASVEAVTPEMVQQFFRSPWPRHAHPLRDLA
ncbi:enoyl-CoA hydratase/isomerase family protein [Caldimonas thermodepolymerans]|jgi:Enoyl-CoA hydratase/carnithine racemase|uniref:enoyl-CoA hydratase/isomerase family protein n=1 Tax=Caldimonas thermodepolymerans TaxID=215580 RepID=UPI002492ABB3|nr:enoyl-CoA hydratase/isomerase family protein [Caldimonas thermodepolymerans]